MTAYQVVRLWCDGDVDRCGQRFERVSPSVESARSWASHAGWTSAGDKDFCPDHKPDPKEGSDG